MNPVYFLGVTLLAVHHNVVWRDVCDVLSAGSWALPPPIRGPLVFNPPDPPKDTLHEELEAPPPPMARGIACDGIFRCQWLDVDGSVGDVELPNRVELSSTQMITNTEQNTGGHIISQMMANSPTELFNALTTRGTVGFFTFPEATTIFPEYLQYRDRPECAGTCAGACSNTCTGDGRKYDSLAGLGGSRGTCVNVNYMCHPGDPYGWSYSVLVHEVAHTIHQYALPYVRPGGIDYWTEIWNAWNNARAQGLWDNNSYAMTNHLEYFAEASGVFFNVNHHPSSSGGMNGCNRPSGFCQTESEARNWLRSRDPRLYDALSYTYTNYQDWLPGDMTICP